MVATPVQSNAAAQNTGLATVAATWTTPATAGNLLLLIVGADDYRTTTGSNRPESSGFTLSTGCAQETFLGHYVWWKVAAGGETSVNYTIGSASPSAWITAEISGLEASPYDISAGQLSASSGNTYTTQAITPTAGDRFIIASMGGSLGSAGLTDLNTWLNSFTEIRDVATVLASGTRDIVGIASNSVTANGSTSYSSGATYNATPQARTGIILAFKIAGGGTNATATPATIACTMALPRANVNTAANPATAATTAALPRAAVNVTAGPAVIAATVALPTPTVLAGGNATATPATIALTASLPRAAVNTAAGPAVIPITVTLPQAGLNAAAGPQTIATTVTIPQPAVNTTVGPQTIAATVALPAAVISTAGSATASPATIAVSVTLPQSGVNVTAGTAVIAATVTLPQPAAGVNTVASPATIATSAALPAPGMNVAAGPSTVALTVTLPLATIAGTLANATSVAAVVAAVASVAAVSAGRTSSATVGRSATSTPTVSDG